MNTINILFQPEKARCQWCTAVAGLALLLFPGCFSSIPLNFCEAVVLFSGASGAGIFGYAGTVAIQAGLVATLYVVAGEVVVHSSSNPVLREA